MNTLKCNCLIVFLLVQLFPWYINAQTINNTRFFRDTGTLSFNDQQLSLLNDFVIAKDSPESVISLLEDISPEEMSKLQVNDKILIIKVNNILFDYYFFKEFNFERSTELLKQNLTLCDETGYDKSDVYLNLAFFNHSLSEINSSEELVDKAISFYDKAIIESMKNCNSAAAVSALINIISIYSEKDKLEDVEPYFKRVEEVVSAKGTAPHIKDYFAYLINYYGALKAISSYNPGEGIEILNKQLNSLPFSGSDSRREHCQILIMRSEAHNQMGNTLSAISDLQNVLNLSNRKDLADIHIMCLKKLSSLSQQLNDTLRSREFKLRYLELSDSIGGYNPLLNVAELNSMEQIERMSKEINSHRDRFLLLIFILSLIFILTVYLSFLRIKKRKLKIEDGGHIGLESKKSSSLYVMKLEEEKYKNSSLDEKRKEDIKRAIDNVMQKEEEICSSDFSADRLSFLTGISYKHLSQVINECYGLNFNSLLNEHRIEIACRIMMDANGNNYTIEGIANMVGFKSRSAFGRIFKTLKGVSPSEYMKQDNSEY